MVIKIEDFAASVRNAHRGRFYCNSCRANLTRIVYETPTDGREHFRSCPRCGRKLRIDSVMKAVQMLAGTPRQTPMENEVKSGSATLRRRSESPTVWLVTKMSKEGVFVRGCYQDPDRAELSCAGWDTEQIRILPLRLDEIMDRKIDLEWKDNWEPGRRPPAQSATPHSAEVKLKSQE